MRCCLDAIIVFTYCELIDNIPDCSGTDAFHVGVADLPLVKAKPNESTLPDGMDFRSWKYATVKAYLDLVKPVTTLSLQDLITEGQSSTSYTIARARNPRPSC